MTEYMTLLGAEQVQSAARTIESAASEMTRAASTISYALDAQQRFMDDWLQRFERAMEKSNAKPSALSIGMGR